MLYRNDKHGEPISILGYGCMRFTKKGTGIDIDKAEKEILSAFEKGINYYDTAYLYQGSEAALGLILERNGIRDKVNIATKLPQYMVKSSAAIDRYFNEELARLRTDYIDYYLLHCIMENNYNKYEKFQLWDFVNEEIAVQVGPRPVFGAFEKHLHERYGLALVVVE